MTGNNRLRALLAAALAMLLSLAAPGARAQSDSPAPGASYTPIQLDTVSLQFGHLSGTPDHAVVDHPELIYGGEMTVQADRLEGNLLQQQYDATGNVRVHEADTAVAADSLHMDGADKAAVMRGAQLTQNQFTLRADQLQIQPTSIHAVGGRLQTVPPGESPAFEVRAGVTDIDPASRKGVLRQASFYLFHARLFTLQRVPFTLSQPGSTGPTSILPTIGFSGRYGTYLSYGRRADSGQVRYFVLVPERRSPQIKVTAQQTLYAAPRPAGPPNAATLVRRHEYLAALRTLSMALDPPLPAGDPLLFHGFLPDAAAFDPLAAEPLGTIRANEEVSSHVEATGRRIDNLYVSRLPEVALHGQWPLTAVPSPPVPRDPDSYRHNLRQIVLVGSAETAVGYYEEQPENASAVREQVSGGISLQPLLIAPNTLIRPSLQVTSNTYSGRKFAYQYVEAGIEAAHYFSDRSDISIGLLDAGTRGDSPFNFDVLDTREELDAGVQIGNHKLALAGLIRYDMQNGGFIDYRFAVAPGLSGITPLFVYSFRSRSISVGIDISGLMF